MLKLFLLLSLWLLAVLGCAAPPLNPAADINHPANPDAAESPLSPPSQTLAATSSTQPATGQSMPGTQMDHDMGGMNHDHHEH